MPSKNSFVANSLAAHKVGAAVVSPPPAVPATSSHPELDAAIAALPHFEKLASDEQRIKALRILAEAALPNCAIAVLAAPNISGGVWARKLAISAEG